MKSYGYAIFCNIFSCMTFFFLNTFVTHSNPALRYYFVISWPRWFCLTLIEDTGVSIKIIIDMT